MKKGFFFNISFHQKILLFLLLFFLLSFIMLYINSIFLDKNNIYIYNSISNIRISILLNQIITFLVPSILFVYYVRPFLKDSIKLKGLNFHNILLIFSAFIFIFLISRVLSEWNQQINPDLVSKKFGNALKEYQSIKDNFMNNTLGNTLDYYMFNIFLIAILPAFCEELFFRGVLQNLLVKLFNNIHIGIVSSALFFALIHIDFYNFLPIFFIGLIFGYLYVFTSNIFITIILHFLYNFSSLSIYYLEKNEILSSYHFDNISLLGYTLILISFVSLLFLLNKMKYIEIHKNRKT
jgi:uncharacterized protein